MRRCWSRRSRPTLVIDDDDVVRKTCVELLEARGHKTLAAASVGEGPAALRRAPAGGGAPRPEAARRHRHRRPARAAAAGAGHAGGRDLRPRQRRARPWRPCRSAPPTSSRSRSRATGSSRSSTASCTRRLPGGETDLEKVADGSRYGMVRPLGGHAAHLPAHRDGGAHQVPRVHLGRERDGQGADRARHPRPLAPPRAARSSSSTARPSPAELIESEMFGHVQGRLHGRGGRPQGQVRERPPAARSSSTRSGT